MNSINFIKSLTPRQQQALSRWYNLSIAALLCTVFVLGCLQVKQLYMWYTLSTKQASLQAEQEKIQKTLQDYTNLKDQEHVFAQKEAELKQITRMQRLLPTYLNTLITALGNNNVLHNVCFHENQLELHLTSKSTQTALQAVHTLAGIPHYTKTMLQSIHTSKDNKSVSANITATLTP